MASSKLASRVASLRPANKTRPWTYYVPVCGALGAVAMSATLGLGTAALEVAHAPNVRLDKKKREAVPEVAAPDLAVDEAERFLRSSLFRRAARVVLGDAAAPGPVAEKKAVTLKDAGVEPPGIERTREEVLGNFCRRITSA
ncbi:hypothetical protein QOZ80_9BG0712840 [Eleusine coracana subsp. coracana]|nr:hypothetical protein QOZ80_9BG0712840 [Eleusine coracana subsp. coracana]